MRKKRKNQEASGDFRNDAFHSLKNISARPRSAGAVPAANGPSDEDADEGRLFARSVRGARPISRGEEAADEQPTLPRTARSAKPDADAENDANLFLQAMSAIGTGTVWEERTYDREPDAERSRRSSSGRMRQLKKGTIRIAQELDLHGLLRDEALRKLQHYIAAACARGEQAVLVITGKGINSPDGPVLPGAVRNWLQGPGKSMVAEFHAAPRDRGGSGAVVVFLRGRT
jgi:DNA-nicking Smr family endonuclease